MLVAAVDVHYRDDGSARAALIVCADATCSVEVSRHIVEVAEVARYESGALYRRELPCIARALIDAPTIDLLLVDGYATLDPNGSPGLGAYASRLARVPVIGIAKTKFHSATHAEEVVRRPAKKPLYVTTAGDISIVKGAQIVREMAGAARIPWLLGETDRAARAPR